MKRIEDIDSDLVETKYVHNIVSGKGQIAVVCGIPIFDSIVKSQDTFQLLDNFQERYNKGKIAIRYKYEDYINDKDMQATIIGLGMNPNAFWLLVVFCFDYACDCCYNGRQSKQFPKDTLTELVDMITTNTEKTTNGKLQLVKDMSLSLKMKGKSLNITSENAIIGIAYALDKCMDEMNNSLTYNEMRGGFYDKFEESDSVLIWFFAKLLLYFFELHPEFKGRATKGSGISLNKHVLISNLIYYTGLTRNEKFLNDDETLKGYLRQYKNKDFKNRGSIYN